MDGEGWICRTQHGVGRNGAQGQGRSSRKENKGMNVRGNEKRSLPDLETESVKRIREHVNSKLSNLDV